MSFIEAVKRVWRNMRDENKMKENGKVQQHRERNKAAKRKRDVIVLFQYNFIFLLNFALVKATTSIINTCISFYLKNPCLRCLGCKCV